MRKKERNSKKYLYRNLTTIQLTKSHQCIIIHIFMFFHVYTGSKNQQKNNVKHQMFLKV